jgi:hypothetical protein
MLHAEHRAGQIDRQCAVPRLDGGINDTLARDRPGIVDENMKLAEMRQRRRYRLFPGCLVGDVLPQEQDLGALSTEPLRQTLAGIGIDIGQYHRSLFADEKLRFRASLPTRSTGDQRHFTC